jgi:hypothetical protein
MSKRKATIDIPLGSAPEVYQLFSYANPNLQLTDVIAHGFNQTLQRDGLWGSWAQAYVDKKTAQYRLKISSPTHDVADYGPAIRNYLAAGRKALETYNAKGIWGHDFQFLLPFGLPLLNVRSVQLFHFPPTETFSYVDYLYSPTNRRWECLLAQNGFEGQQNASVERIVDVVPIAAAGGASKEIEPYNVDFIDYGRKQLKNFLDGSGKVTQPVVAYGGPVRDWLWLAYGKQIAQQLDVAPTGDNPLRVLSLITLEIVKGVATPLLCANHPSMYLYDTNIPVKDATKVRGDFPTPLEVMRDDLVAAGWQAAMAPKWSANATSTLKKMQRRWSDDEAVKAIMREQNAEFGYAR